MWLFLLFPLHPISLVLDFIRLMTLYWVRQVYIGLYENICNYTILYGIIRYPCIMKAYAGLSEVAR